MKLGLCCRPPINLRASTKESFYDTMEQVPSLAGFVDRRKDSGAKLCCILERPGERIVDELMGAAERFLGPWHEPRSVWQLPPSP